MKKIYIQKEVVSWEQYTYEVEDNFSDYDSLVNSMDWIEWEYLPEPAENTGNYLIYDEDYNEISQN